MKKFLIRLVFLLHRYLGMGLGLLMLLWCLSGFVMMYVQYPELDERQRVANLSGLSLDDCCRLPRNPEMRAYPLGSVRVEMLADRPVLRAMTSAGPRAIDLVAGRSLDGVGRRTARAVSARFLQANGMEGEPLYLGETRVDQWTVYGSYDPHRPLYHFSADNEAGTEWYVSSRTGEVVQVTNAAQRLWNYPGAVLHWLYPTLVRQNTALWAQIVIWLSVLGVFLTVTGLYIGIRQYRSRRNGRKSPYRGWALWHHYTGLIFGVLTLTWVLSGLFSMNPWGLLRSDGPGQEMQALRGDTLSWQEISAFLEQLPSAGLPPGTVRLELAPLRGEPFFVSHDAAYERQRYHAESFRVSALTPEDLNDLAERLQRGRPPQSVQMLSEGDAYYYSHHNERQFPVLRVIADDEQSTRYYLDPVSGGIRDKVDSNARWYRWLHYGLHRLDFTALLRDRPVWDFLLWTLMGGVTLVCATGAYMGLKRMIPRHVRRETRAASATVETAR